jgi:hypothetical protein
MRGATLKQNFRMNFKNFASAKYYPVRIVGPTCFTKWVVSWLTIHLEGNSLIIIILAINKARTFSVRISLLSLKTIFESFDNVQLQFFQGWTASKTSCSNNFRARELAK